MIELKRKNLEEIYRFMDRIQLNKIVNANVRKLVLKFVLEGKKNVNAVSNEIEEIRKKFFDGFKPENLDVFQKGLNEIAVLFREKKIQDALDKDSELSKNYPEITEAYKGFNQALADLHEDTMTINVEKVTTDEFVDAMIGQDVTIDGSILDLLNPIFNDESEN